jgi:hypothetical protein
VDETNTATSGSKPCGAGAIALCALVARGGAQQSRDRDPGFSTGHHCAYLRWHLLAWRLSKVNPGSSGTPLSSCNRQYKPCACRLVSHPAVPSPANPRKVATARCADCVEMSRQERCEHSQKKKSSCRVTDRSHYIARYLTSSQRSVFLKSSALCSVAETHCVRHPTWLGAGSG